MKIYDLRTDTITKPSDEMRKAIYEAECGDDVYMEDPTVNKLQEMAAEITGKEKAIFVSSGTMGNLIPMLILGTRSKQMLLEEESHIMHYELGGASSLAGIMTITTKADRGILTKSIVEKYLSGDVVESRKLQLSVNELVSSLFIEVNPIPVKAAMNLMGMEAGDLRLPLTDISKQNLEILRSNMIKYGIEVE